MDRGDNDVAGAPESGTSPVRENRQPSPVIQSPIIQGCVLLLTGLGFVLLLAIGWLL